MQAIEALADAIMTFEGWHYGTRSWRNRNPGNLRPYNENQLKDAENYRIFISLAEGWQALLEDLNIKLTKDFQPTNTLIDLLNKYAPAGDNNNPNQYARFVASYLTNVLQKTITPTSPLSIF